MKFASPVGSSAGLTSVHIGIFPATAKVGLRQEALRALASSLSGTPHRVDWNEGKKYKKCDLAVIYGFPGSSGRRGRIRRIIASGHQGPILIFETPLFGRRVPSLRPGILPFIKRRPDEAFDRFRVSLNGCFWDDGIFCNEPNEASRWETLRNELSLEVKDYRRNGDHLLLVGQVPGDASLRGLNIIEWLESTAFELVTLSDRPIIIRPHPRSDHGALRAVMRRLSSARRIAWDTEPSSSFSASLANAWATITYSSGAAIDSVLMGIPAISMCPSSMAWPVTDHELKKINAPTLYSRQQWLNQLAHSQWAIPEIENGTVWARFEDKIAVLVETAKSAQQAMLDRKPEFLNVE